MGLKSEKHDLKQMRAFFREREERAYFKGLVLGAVAGFGCCGVVWAFVAVIF